jgi:hypothetical protein
MWRLLLEGGSVLGCGWQGLRSCEAELSPEVAIRLGCLLKSRGGERLSQSRAHGDDTGPMLASDDGPALLELLLGRCSCGRLSLVDGGLGDKLITPDLSPCYIPIHSMYK